MKKRHYYLSMEIDVFDPEQLHQTALAADPGARALLRDKHGRVAINACLITLIDPGTLAGCEILGTDVEATGRR